MASLTPHALGLAHLETVGPWVPARTKTTLPPPFPQGIGCCWVSGPVVRSIFLAPKAPEMFFCPFFLMLVNWWVGTCLVG